MSKLSFLTVQSIIQWANDTVLLHDVMFLAGNRFLPYIKAGVILMTTLTGIKDAEYLAQFLGKKIAIRAGTGCWIFPKLWEIHADGTVKVMDSNGVTFNYTWDVCENPYVMLQENMEIEFK